MPRFTPSELDLYNALKDEGFELPRDCGGIKLEMPVDGLFQLCYKINLYGEELAKVGRALARLGEERK